MLPILISLVILLFGLVAMSSGRGKNFDFRGLVIVSGGVVLVALGDPQILGRSFEFGELRS
jgi:hypothetical protein